MIRRGVLRTGAHVYSPPSTTPTSSNVKKMSPPAWLLHSSSNLVSSAVTSVASGIHEYVVTRLLIN